MVKTRPTRAQQPAAQAAAARAPPARRQSQGPSKRWPLAPVISLAADESPLPVRTYLNVVTRRQARAVARVAASPARVGKAEMPEVWCSPYAPGTGESTGNDTKSAHDLEAGALIKSGTNRIKPDSAHMKNMFLKKLHEHGLHERTWNY